ncbi:hypothetical protein [Candidatus Pyrohabitans sp.]
MITRETADAVAKALKRLECQKCELRNAWMKSQAVRELKEEIKKLKRENVELRKRNKWMERAKQLERQLFKCQQTLSREIKRRKELEAK